ncbi:MAG TPA: alpha-amylase [Cytophagales bacterium]|jgi:1,4-alpha-glucan branching enzyme|nr:alpha-amylase [Cytophagales bacterium]
MKIVYLFILVIFSSLTIVFAQTPVIDPPIFTPSTEITITYDVTGTNLENLSEAWLWCWMPQNGGDIDATSNINPANSDSNATDQAKFTKTTEGGKTLFTLTFTPQDFFDEDISTEDDMGLIIKGNDWADGQTSNYIVTFYQGGFEVTLQNPRNDPQFVDTNDELIIEAFAIENATFTLSINGTQVDQKTGLSEYSYTHLVTETSGQIPMSLFVEDETTDEDTTINFSYILRIPSVSQPLPDGIIPGINYHDNDDTKATLCLWAPGKNSAFVLGEFNDFKIDANFQMFYAGEYFWLEITGLNPGEEYAFQYLVDESIYIADPYSEKILDPDDRFIPETIYPNLKPYPEAALKPDWYKNRLAIIETAQEEFNWQHTDYNRPAKEDLIVYELHIRDFFAEDDRNYLNLIDTLSYLQELGVNTIELMPIQEFAGNSSWGYNPTFMFAVDKAYGTEEALKQFIDAAHEKGIAVVLDIVFNHMDVPNPYVAMWFDYGTFTVEPDNPMFNVTATHPFSVFFDMNHESDMAKHFMDTTIHYWINEYKVDGFRFDLSKGFTQTNSGNDVGAWSSRDNSRIALLKRMADKVWSYAPDNWLILEHFADNAEETELSEYGMMLWGNMHGSYKETILGFHDNNKSNLEWGYAKERGWDNLNLVTYMESHDEERQTVEARENGRIAGDYNTRRLSTALERIKAASAFLYFTPGPKMLWQFGELGYDISINENGRTGEKPVKWEYYDEPARKKLYDVISEITALRSSIDLTNAGFNWSVDGETKWISIDADPFDITIATNFDVISKEIAPQFAQTGTWYDLFTDETIEVTGSSQVFTYAPGQFHIFTSQEIEGVKSDLVPWNPNRITSVEDELIDSNIIIYPNPAQTEINVSLLNGEYHNISIHDMNGRFINDVSINPGGITNIDVSTLNSGMYYLRVETQEGISFHKFLKN